MITASYVLQNYTSVFVTGDPLANFGTPPTNPGGVKCTAIACPPSPAPHGCVSYSASFIVIHNLPNPYRLLPSCIPYSLYDIRCCRRHCVRAVWALEYAAMAALCALMIASVSFQPLVSSRVPNPAQGSPHRVLQLMLATSDEQQTSVMRLRRKAADSPHSSFWRGTRTGPICWWRQMCSCALPIRLVIVVVLRATQYWSPPSAHSSGAQ